MALTFTLNLNCDNSKKVRLMSATFESLSQKTNAGANHSNISNRTCLQGLGIKTIPPYVNHFVS